MPQALANMIPSLLNQFVSTIKATSIVYIIGVNEAAFSAQQINSIELTGTLRTYLVLALFYFLICALLSRLAKILEAHLNARRLGTAT
jgi:polar amino acid transport system permease protein